MINFGTKNSAIGIILGMNIVFFSVWVISLFLGVTHPAFQSIPGKLYDVFAGVNSALLLILNTEAKQAPADQKSTPAPETNPTPPSS